MHSIFIFLTLVTNIIIDSQIIAYLWRGIMKKDEKKEDIYSNIDEMLNSTLNEEEKNS